MDPAGEERAARIRAGIERWNEGALDSAEENFHQDMVWEEAPLFPDAGVHRGRDASVARMAERVALLGEVQIEVVDIRLRDSFALVEVIVRGVGAASGAPAETREYFVYELADDGRIIHWREFLDRGPAEEAFGPG